MNVVSTLNSILVSLRTGGTLHRMPIAQNATANASQVFELRQRGQKVGVPYWLARRLILNDYVASNGKAADGSELYLLKIKGRGAAADTTPRSET